MSSAALVQCTFYDNEASAGSHISADCDGTLSVDRCLIVGGQGSASIFVDPGSSSIQFVCSDIWGNAQGDWTAPIADQLGQDGNISADPLFCDPTTDDYTVAIGSPCAPENAPDCGQIGAWPVGCAWPTGAPHAADLVLHPCAPNPFNPSTTIRFDLASARQVTLQIHALDGRTIRQLVDGWRGAGRHRVRWDGRDASGRDVPSGVYVYRLETDVERVARSITLVR